MSIHIPDTHGHIGIRSQVLIPIPTKELLFVPVMDSLMMAPLIVFFIVKCTFIFRSPRLKFAIDSRGGIIIGAGCFFPCLF